MQKKFFVAATVTLLSGMTMTAANADQINVYVHASYGGSDRVITGPIRDLGDIGFNDHISSFIVKSGNWELCEHANYEGRCITTSGSDGDLTRIDFNDRISSARPVGSDRRGDRGRDRGRDRDRDGWGDRDSGRGDVVLYVDSNFSGRSRTIGGTTGNVGNFNDETSSIQIRSGTWEFCEHSEFGGRCVTFDRDIRWLGEYGFNDRISSVRRVR